jgi:hypothetical protein
MVDNMYLGYAEWSEQNTLFRAIDTPNGLDICEYTPDHDQLAQGQECEIKKRDGAPHGSLLMSKTYINDTSWCGERRGRGRRRSKVKKENKMYFHILSF